MDPLWHDEGPVRVGISSCLLGQAVRHDGGHKRDSFLADELAPYVEWIPVCPEVELGMGTPREPVQLVRAHGGLRLLGTRSQRDWTEAMESFTARRVRALEHLELCGYVLKQDSPSCGMERVKVRGARGLARRAGRGLFAEALLRASPELPVEEEGRLRHPDLRENWIERVFAYRRLRALLGGRFSASRLVAFHAAHELQVLAHGAKAHRRLGRLVAGARQRGRAELRQRYAAAFMAALAERATPRRQVNVLRHCLGYFEDRLDPQARAALAARVGDYQEGLVPLTVPVSMIRHYVVRFGIEALAGQVYLEPHPKELMLRNHG